MVTSKAMQRAERCPRHRNGQHRPVKGFSRIANWTRCVSDDSEQACTGEAHGGVTYTDRCACGATRRTEGNGRYIVRGAWWIVEHLP